MVSTYTQPDYTAQADTPYKTNLDDAAAVFKRLAAAFAPHEQASASPQPDMTVELDAGSIFASAAVPTAVAAQSTAVLTAPSANPRKDIVHIDMGTGTVGVATGTEAASPSDPAIPEGKIPIARVNLTTSMTEIVNADIDDLRPPGLFAAGLSSYIQNGKAVFAEAVSGSPTGSDYTVTLTPAITAYADGQRFLVRPDANCLVQPTIAFDGLPQKGLFKDGGDTVLAADDWLANRIYEIGYNTNIGLGSPQGGGFEVLSPLVAAAAGSGLTSIANTAGSATANIDFTGFSGGSYDNYKVLVGGLTPGNDAVILEMETSTDGGTGYDTGASDYAWVITSRDDLGNDQSGQDPDDTEIQLTGTKAVGSAANENVSADITIYRPEDAEFTQVSWSISWRMDADRIVVGSGAAERQSAADVDAIRFHYSAGNHTAQGSIQFLGIAQ